MTQVNSSTGIVKCHLWIEELLQFDGLRNGATCVGCSVMVGAHARKSDCLEPVIRSTKHCQTDFQPEETYTNGTINQQQTPSIVAEDASISPPDKPQSKHTPSSSSQSMSSSTSSAKSRNSAEALVRIRTAPLVPESETSKQNMAIARQLKRQAMTEAAEARCKKIKHFLSKYCCLEGTNPNDLYHKLIFLLNNDHKRFYYLVQHARYNCLGLIQLSTTIDQIVRLFELMHSIIPFEN